MANTLGAQPFVANSDEHVRRVFRDVLQSEVKARIADREPDVTLGHGERIGDGACNVYEFTRDLGYKLGVHDPVLLWSGAAAAQATVLHHAESLVIASDIDFGCVIEDARLTVDRSWILDRLRQRLRKSTDKYGLAMSMLCPESIKVQRAELPVDLTYILNEEQLAYVSTALGSSVTYGWGPPGTGKSYMLAHCLVVAMRRGHRCLAVTPTNSAADELARYVAACAEQQELLEHKVLRVGLSSTLEGDCAEHMLLHRIVDKMRSENHAAFRQSVEPDRIARSAIKRSRVVITTVHQTFLNDAVAHEPFDHVFVDEAAQMLLPMVYHAATMASKHVSIIGDFAQLSAPFKSNDPKAIATLGTDIFHTVGLAEAIEDGNAPECVAALSEQGRMDPPINQLCSDLFYAGRLRCSGSITKRGRFESPVGRASVILVDSSDAPVISVPRTSAGHTNEHHAGLIADMVRDFSEWNYSECDMPSIAVLTPFRAQRDLLVAKLPEYRGMLTVSTVHGFQSRAADVVVFDLPEHSGPPSHFSRATAGREPGGRMINVAISRARRQLIVVANTDYYRSIATRGTVASRLIEEIETNEMKVMASDLVA